MFNKIGPQQDIVLSLNCLQIEFAQNTYTDATRLRQILPKAAIDGFGVVVGGLLNSITNK